MQPVQEEIGSGLILEDIWITVFKPQCQVREKCGGHLIDYRIDPTISTDQFVDILRRSSLSERRPVEDTDCMQNMLRHADIIVSAWNDDLLVGVARSVTDFSYCCYLSDLAVDRHFQRAGIGLELIRQTRAQLGPRCALILLAAPAAAAYYPHIGFAPHDSAWVIDPDDRLRGDP